MFEDIILDMIGCGDLDDMLVKLFMIWQQEDKQEKAWLMKS